MSQRVVVVTGCSSGFGLHIAVEAAAAGWRVFATMRSLERRADLDTAVAQRGVSVEVVALDVTDDNSVERAVDEVLATTGGRLDAVVHNAGIGHGGFFEDQDEAAFRAVLETNFFGVTRLSRAVLPALRAAGGRMVLISSVSGYNGNPALSAYVASKWALEGWAESVATELRPFGVDVVVVEPGFYRTAIVDNAEIARSPGSAYAGWVDGYEAKIRAMAAKASADPADVGRLVAKLLAKRRVAFRYPVGRGARTGRLVVRVVPFGWRSCATARWAGLRRVRR